MPYGLKNAPATFYSDRYAIYSRLRCFDMRHLAPIYSTTIGSKPFLVNKQVFTRNPKLSTISKEIVAIIEQ